MAASFQRQAGILSGYVFGLSFRSNRDLNEKLTLDSDYLNIPKQNAVGLWMGLKGDDALDHTLPNRMNFDKCSLWSDHDIFENGVSSWKCDENDADGDGVVDGADQCPNSGWFQVADEFGCTSPTLEPTPAPFAPTAKPTNRVSFISSFD